MRSFAGRLTWRIVLLMLLTMIIPVWLVYEAAYSMVQEEECSIHETFLDGNVEEIRRVTSDVCIGASNHVPEIEENLGNPDRLFALMERVVSQNPRIRSCGISFMADYYPQKGRWFTPYAVRLSDGQIETKNVGDASHDYLKSEWFIEAMKASESYWSKPFFEGTDSITPLVSYLIPIHDRTGRTVAVLGADLSLGWLRRKMESADKDLYKKEWTSTDEGKMPKEKPKKKRHVFKRPYSFIITSNGTYIVHPDSTRILHKNFLTYTKQSADTADDNVARQMMAGKKGFYGKEDEELISEMELEGQDVFFFFAPVKNTDWSVATVVPTRNINIIAVVVGVVLLLLIGIGLLAAFIVSRIVIRRATKPLKQLALSADEVAKGNFNTPLPVIKHNDEIGVLRDSFDDMQHSLVKYIDELKDTTASKAVIENELKIAHDIQMGMLPKTYPPYPERNDIEIYGSLNPAKEVGGDLFDFYIRDNQMFFCIGDVSGKGVPASLVMAVTRSLFRNISAHTAKPNHIASALNEALAEGNETNMFVTSFIGVLNLTTGILRYCNAGHNAPMLIGRGVGLLPCDPNLPLGVMPGWEYTVQEADIDPLTTIFLFTDGLTEAENADHALFGEERVTAIAQQMLAEGRNTPEEIISRMKEEIQAFVDGASQSDDQTMLAIKYLSPTLPKGEGGL